MSVVNIAADCHAYAELFRDDRQAYSNSNFWHFGGIIWAISVKFTTPRAYLLFAS